MNSSRINLDVNVTYNNTAYAMSNLTNKYTFNKSLFVDMMGAGLNETKTFWFNWTAMYLSNLVNRTNSTKESHNITKILISNDTNFSSYATLNFNLREEENLTSMNGTIEINFKVWTESEDYYRNFSFDLPVASNLTTGNISFYIYPLDAELTADADIAYTALNYDLENYYLTDAPLNNDTQNITLYLIAEADSSIIYLKTVDEGNTALGDIIIKILRYYVGQGSYYTIEMTKTSELGYGVGHLVENDVDYKFILEQDGVVKKSTSPMKIVCLETPCSIEFTITEGLPDIFESLEDIEGLSYNLYYNNDTDYVILTFSDTTGLSPTMRLEVIQQSGTGSDVICNDTLDSTAGTISCLIDRNGTFMARAYRETSPERFLNAIWVVKEYVAKVFAEEGVMWLALLVMALVLVGVWNPSASIFLGIFGFIMFGVIAGWSVTNSIMVVIYAIIVLVIIAFKVRT